MGNQLTIKSAGLSQAQILALIAANAAPLAHKTQHQNGGSDAITVQGLAGVLTAEQLSSWTGVSGKPTTFAPAAHNTNHYITGSDKLISSDLVTAVSIDDATSQTKIGLTTVGIDGYLMNSSTSGVTTTIRNLSGGVLGQRLFLSKITGVASTTLSVIDGNSTGGQPIYLMLHTNATITSYAEGIWLICTGSDWREIKRV